MHTWFGLYKRLKGETFVRFAEQCCLAADFHFMINVHISTCLCICIIFLRIHLFYLCSNVRLSFPHDSGVQTVLQASYESWGFRLHKAATGKERKNRSGEEEGGEHLLSSSAQQGRALACHSERDSQLLQHTHRKYMEYFGVLLKLSGVITFLVYTIIKRYILYYSAIKIRWKAHTTKKDSNVPKKFFPTQRTFSFSSPH